MRHYLFILAALFGLTLQAQVDGKKILDKAADKIATYGDVCIEFRATTYNGTKELGKMEGKMLLQDMKYQLDTPEMMTWYDGLTQWTLIPENKEVNITNPTAEEIQAVHPYSFLSLYKSGYDVEVKDATLRNQAVYEVHLTAQKKDMPIQELYVDVRKSDYALYCLRVRQGKDWNRISLQTIQGGLKFSDADFTFPKKKYPDYEIIDLR